MSMGILETARMQAQKAHCRFQWHAMHWRKRIASEEGQGTTEYAILVGILVVIAILAITVFRPKIEELWKAISDAIMGL